MKRYEGAIDALELKIDKLLENINLPEEEIDNDKAKEGGCR